jgi:hypothetical protein
LRTRAERFTGEDGKEYYRVNGQKTWTTMAQHADWGFFLVRTDPTAKIQEGISFLLIDMKTPGITVRPIITLGGEHEVNEVWLEDVIVPVENRVFHENKGWTCAKFLLAHERTGIAGVAASKRNVERIKDVARKTEDGGEALMANPFFKRKVAELEVDLAALEYTELRTLAGESSGKGPGPEASMLKVKGTEVGQRLTELTLDPPQASGDLAGDPLKDEDWLVLSTVHSAKGQEWDAVYVIDVTDGNFPNEYQTGSDAGIDEERRLLYVAMTRAKDTLQLVEPLRHAVVQQPRLGGAYVHAARSRFMTRPVLATLRRIGPPPAPVPAGSAPGRAPPVDVGGKIRSMF